jgi:ribose transport system substrate-binding protein
MALANARQLLAKYPDLSGFFGVYGYHPGAQLRALKELGVRRDIKIVGFDILPRTIEGLRSGEIAASVWIREYHFGYLGGAVLFNMLTLGIKETLALLGLDPDSGQPNAIRLAPSVLTPENLGEFLREYGQAVGVGEASR